MNPDFAEIASHFRFDGTLERVERLPSGHINDSYAASFHAAGGETRRYLLQRINHHVFRSPERLMDNIEAITEHIRARVLAAGGDPNREALSLVRTVDGGVLHRTPHGDSWRAAIFIEGARTYKVPANPNHVTSAGRAFGIFQSMVSDFPAERLHETIPDFHHTPKRLDALRDAVRRDPLNRAHSAQAEIEFALERAADASHLLDLQATGALPLRVTHNDTKFDNVLIDDVTGQGICVIDLDTVMPGLSLYDFGDAVRSTASTAAEDEPDLSRVSFDLDLFERLATGYLEATGDLLNPAEIDLLPFGAWLMTFECGIRFLTDHLNGDRYFRIARPGHNLDRCRTQFKLAGDMETERSTMERIVERCCAGLGGNTNSADRRNSSPR